MSFEILLLTTISFIIFCLLYEIVRKYDKESFYSLNSIETVMIAFSSLILAIVSYCFNSNILSRILSIIFLSILLYDAVCDAKTKQVYRLFNLINIGIGFICFICSFILNLKSLSSTQIVLILSGMIIYDLIIMFMASGIIKKLSVMGMGDTLALIATAFYLTSITMTNVNHFTIEILLWHYIFAVVLLFIFNIKHFLNKKLRASENIAFLPDVLGAILICCYTLI